MNFRQIPVENGMLLYFPDFLDKSESGKFLIRLREEIQWKQEIIRIFGKSHPTPRLTAWYGDEGKTYSYSGLKLSPQTPCLWTLGRRQTLYVVLPLSRVLCFC